MAKGERKSRSGRTRRHPRPSIAKVAAADAAMTAIFILSGSLLVEGQPLLSGKMRRLGLVSDAAAEAGAVAVAVLVAFLLFMAYLSKALGGSLNNPAANAMLWAVGKGSAREHLIRAAAQLAGGIAAAGAAHVVLPSDWRDTLGGLAIGLRPGVALLSGAACEAVLSALLAFAVLASGDFRSPMLQLWLPIAATVLAIKAGEPISGPALNPVLSSSWHAWYGIQGLAEHLLVFWACPVVASLFGAWAYLGFKQWWQQQHKAAVRQQQRAKRASGHAKAD